MQYSWLGHAIWNITSSCRRCWRKNFLNWLMTGYMQPIMSHQWHTILPGERFAFKTLITSRRTFSRSGTASMNPANLALAVAKSSAVRVSQSCGKKGFAIVALFLQIQCQVNPNMLIFTQIKHCNKIPRVSPAGICLWMVVCYQCFHFWKTDTQKALPDNSRLP